MLNSTLIFTGIVLILLLSREILIRNKNSNVDFINKKISSKNKILFIKLQKEYLNNCSDDDILELCSFLYHYYLNRRLKNENKK